MCEEKILMNKHQIDESIKKISNDIINEFGDMSNVTLVGIQTRGVEIAKRIKKLLELHSGNEIKMGTLDITFYRDDLATRGIIPAIKETTIEFNITKKIVILVDDVIFTGRTTKAAMETLMSFGRPQIIRLAVLIDRGNRELPIQPDYCGIKINTKLNDKVKVRLNETDGIEDTVLWCVEEG
ncbi:MAG: bifunctional pyr operon transcriptional regulator/uracil phosphoribosyltransferase PyrR [Spirochaetes bacterium]|nr:bifunctional pyr operon transcriptional regulator/uracil phosphoribosyltransferase PyrR [Spirochaetota bacterium]MBP8987222.1 bifunctional pyr operon transcriptional regulator/uracil phosphoribosyltransferase PyrR [Spirochaetota bacterium]HQL42832.1 bifunctional pyr operon transcriptional regulator/uracil phosphoribosyltransferase PyrR [Spirochaetota bacterium]HQQ49835.1 bifunctional pyr operon transcriptional regulator/uracil phosphoribosyltransferase PyrR [Spirochaetota bacterium]